MLRFPLKPSLILLLIGLSLAFAFRKIKENKFENSADKKELHFYRGGIVRGDTSKKELALVFTGDEFADGGEIISRTLKKHRIKASFFFTGHFYRNPIFYDLIISLRDNGNYLGAHSDQHLLYCSWENRDSLLVTKIEFEKDLSDNYQELRRFDIKKEDALYFLPPYEWYNDSISLWTREHGLQLVNYTSGTLSHADYTTPNMANYRSNEAILKSIYSKEIESGLSGFILLSHIGVAKERPDKFYVELDQLIANLKNKGYRFRRIDELLKE